LGVNLQEARQEQPGKGSTWKGDLETPKKGKPRGKTNSLGMGDAKICGVEERRRGKGSRKRPGRKEGKRAKINGKNQGDSLERLVQHKQKGGGTRPKRKMRRGNKKDMGVEGDDSDGRGPTEGC